MFKAMRFSKRTLYLLVLSCQLLSACAPKTAVQGVEATQPAAAKATVTATTAPTRTPQPTHTPLPTATATVTITPTPEATATKGPDLWATVNAVATENAEEAYSDYAATLASYGYTPADGHLIWSSADPIEITVKDYSMSRYRNLDAPRTGNFIIQTSVTWNTTGGLAGCGIIFRQSVDSDKSPFNQFRIIRLQNAPAWDISYYDNGSYERSLTKWVYTRSINDKNDSTNVIALVVDGRKIYPYVNGKKQRLVEDITLDAGFFALSALQDSGVSTCTFQDTWIWEIGNGDNHL